MLESISLKQVGTTFITHAGIELSHIERMIQGAKAPQTSEDVFYLSTKEKRQDLEDFRVEYERRHPPADLDKRYTSSIATERQQWLFDNEPQVWFSGLPPFVQEFFNEKIRAAIADHSLDGAPMNWIRSYLEGQVREPTKVISLSR